MGPMGRGSSPRVGWAQGLGGLPPTSCSLAPALQRPLAALWSLPAPTQPSRRGGPGAGTPAAESCPGSFKALGGQPCGYIPGTGVVWGGTGRGNKGPLCFCVLPTPLPSWVGLGQRPRHSPGPRSCPGAWTPGVEMPWWLYVVCGVQVGSPWSAAALEKPQKPKWGAPLLDSSGPWLS